MYPKPHVTKSSPHRKVNAFIHLYYRAKALAGLEIKFKLQLQNAWRPMTVTTLGGQ